MRRVFPIVVIVAVVGAAMLVGHAAIASADNPATITLGTSGCGGLDSNLTCVAAPFRDVTTSDGVEIEVLRAAGVFNDTGHALIFDAGTGFTCVSDVTGARTKDWQETLSASGNSVLVCRFTS